MKNMNEIEELEKINLSKNKKRALRKYIKKITQKRNIKRMNKEPYMGYNKIYSELCSMIPLRFKKMRRRQRRAKEKQALRSGKEVPKFKKDYNWEWW